MSAERTLWKKTTAVHVFRRRHRSRDGQFSRHRYDLASLGDAGFAERSLADCKLAIPVARHKAILLREKDAKGAWIDYEAAVSGALQLVSRGRSCEALPNHYGKMMKDGMLLDDEKQFGCLREDVPTSGRGPIEGRHS